MSVPTNDELWADAANWHWGEYRCAADSRLWVAKRFGAGVTLNMAHPDAWPSVVLVMLALFVPIGGVISRAIGASTSRATLFMSFAVGLAAALAAYRIARRARVHPRAA